ncbi:MAG: sporulation integral membrane protein YtvI [Peptococcaceae bacterium]|nr:sporulation integral membrane protein YtvI [Peptococcaceae bacterium]
MNNTLKSFLLRAVKIIAFWLIVVCLVFLLGRYLYLFIPFILAFILAVMINPLKKFFIKHFNLPKMLAVLLAMALEIGGICAVIALLITRLVFEFQDIMLNLPVYSQNARRVFLNGLSQLETAYLQIPPSYVETFNKSLNNLMDSAAGFIASIPTLVGRTAMLIPEIIIVLVIALVATFFMAKGTERYLKSCLAFFPEEWHTKVTDLGKDFSRAFIGFVRAELIVCGISLLISIFGLLILQAKYAIVLGTVTGIFGILPVLGVGIILVPWAIIAFLFGHTLMGAGLLILTGVVSVVRHVIEPKILGDNVGLDPLLVLASMYIGLAAIGVIGLFVGPFTVIAYQSLRKAGVFRNL